MKPIASSKRVTSRPILVSESQFFDDSMKPLSKKVITSTASSCGNSSLATKSDLSVGNTVVHEMQTLEGLSLSTITGLSSAKRAEWLKVRFVDVISKASPHKKVNLERKKEEEKQKQKVQKKVNLERVEQERKRLKMEAEKQEEQQMMFKRKLQIENERKAFREALEELERTVVIEDNFKVMRDFERLINAPPQEFY